MSTPRDDFLAWIEIAGSLVRHFEREKPVIALRNDAGIDAIIAIQLGFRGLVQHEGAPDSYLNRVQGLVVDGEWREISKHVLGWLIQAVEDSDSVSPHFDSEGEFVRSRGGL